jgi:glycosyltransferase involved in cell wall biosynthesis
MQPVKGGWRRKLGFAISRSAAAALREVDVLHLHGLWTASNLFAARQAIRRDIPYILRPAGMLEPWCMSQRPRKKQLALWMGFGQLLRRAAAIHATSTSEAENIVRFGSTAPVAVIPNGVHTPEPRYALGTKTGRPAVRTLLFLSRLQRKKGLLNLVAAWNATHARFPQWRLVIAGPDEEDHRREVRGLVKELGTPRVELSGPVYGAEKSRLFDQCDVFVLPTFSENFGVVVAEALAAGRPVITTTGAPWSELRSQHCGWWIPIGVEPLTAALQEAMSLSDDERREMGARAQDLARSRYAWSAIAAQTCRLYGWISGTGPWPDFMYGSTTPAGCRASSRAISRVA